MRAGIRLRHGRYRGSGPQTVIPEQVSFDGNELTVAGQTSNLENYKRVLVVGDCNAAATTVGALEDNDAGEFLERRDGVILTGPANTNVNEL